MRRAGLLAATVLVTCALAGCVPEGTAPTPQAPSGPVTTEAPAAPTPTPSPLPSGVLGAGSFVSLADDVDVAGRVEFVSLNGGAVGFRLRGLAGIPEDASLVLQPASRVDDACADTDVIDYGRVSAVPESSTRSLDTAPPLQDPTLWRRVVITEPGRDGCERRPVAAAEIDWGIAPLQPASPLSDDGARSGASGEVSAVGGVLYAYRVAPGDVLSIVAERFGVRVADILALNPFRADPLSPELYADEILNLSVDRR